MMEIRSDIPIRTVIRFLFRSTLLILLFWNLALHTPELYDALGLPRKFAQKKAKIDLKEVISSNTREFSPIRNKHAVILDSFKALSYFNEISKDSVSDSSVLPPFNAWKERELNKQGKVEKRDTQHDKSKSPRRKLNYASAKCGAKVLASNNEAKYRMAILNEKADEYMLNPCKVKTWFIVELCDTIEATQIELVNYELYSSSPKMFSTFWSDVYPSQTWHHLGTFEAKDQRTMQSFDLNTKNMGKFIKVTISSHYGTEHYCPLSVFRILGYSMVYEYADIDEKNEKHSNKKSGANDSLSVTENPKQFSEKILHEPDRKIEADEKNRVSSKPRESSSRPLAFLLKSCELEQKYCSDLDSPITGETCLNQPSCVFLRQAIPFLDKKSECSKVCERKNDTSLNNLNQTSSSVTNASHVPLDTKLSSLSDLNNSTNSSILDGEHNNHFSLPDNNTAEIKIQFNESVVDAESFKGSVEISNPSKKVELPEAKPNSMEEYSETLQHQNTQKEYKASDDGKNCECRSNAKILEEAGFVIDSDDAVESAALIQKESVLIKLSMRIKAAETNLDLINRYLQQLSKLYRQQMEDMQTVFNGTVKALRIASEKASAIDQQQQITIELLEIKMNTLYQEVQFLTQGREDIWKRVLELHGFFVLLEFIMISTIISVCMNKLKKNADFTEKQMEYSQFLHLL